MLKEALQSVLAQDFKGTVEMIVVDDNSSDDTVKTIAQTYPEVRLIYLSQNQGAYVARNQALQIAKGQYIAFLDSDDIWKKNYLSSQILALETYKKNISVSALILWYTQTNEKIIALQKPDLERFISPFHQLLVRSSFIHSPSSIMLKREVFERVGLFDESFRIGADREFYTRCYIHGYQPIFTEQPLVLVRKHNQGQLTDFNLSKIELRKQSRLTYLERLSPLIVQQNLKLLSMDRLYAEIYSTSAREFYREKYYFHWIKSWIEVAKYMSIQYAVLNILRDLFRFTKPYLLPSVLNFIKKLFLSNSLST
jgi:glycosyltransferase involved in cell wall biosynthesis